MINLTNMWRATGGVEHKRFKEWIEFKGNIDFVLKNLNDSKWMPKGCNSTHLEVSDIITRKRGRYGGTYAHWQIALAYAKYLSPEFHIWCNEVVRDRLNLRLSEVWKSLLKKRLYVDVSSSLKILKSDLLVCNFKGDDQSPL